MAKTMKAAYIEQTGPAESIKYGEVPLPEIKDHQLLVKVSAVVVNPVDTYIRSGTYPIKLPKPYILGRDFVGVVESVGSLVTDFKPKQMVWGTNQGLNGTQGTFSDYVIVDENMTYPLPDHVEPKEAIVVIHSGMTACLGLIRSAQLRRGEIIFVNGGAGNVGSAVIQLAHARGASVIATAGSEEKLNWCRSIGADVVINYKTENVQAVAEKSTTNGIHVYWDTTKQPNLELGINLLGPRGRVVLMSGGNFKSTFEVGKLYRKDGSINGFSINNASVEELQAYADIVNRALADGVLKGKIAKELPFSKAAEAHKLLEAGKEVWGRIVLTP